MYLPLQLTFLLTVVLISAVDSAVELYQMFLMTKAATKTAIIDCTFPSDCYFYIHWYQKKDDETLKRVQYVGISDGDYQNDPGFEFLKSEKKAMIEVGVLAQTVEQPELSWTEQNSKRAYIKCKVTGLQNNNYIHWYQQKDGEALRRILYVNKDGTSPVRNADHSEAKDFTVELQNGNNYVLRVNAVKTSHSGVYYCACWYSVSGRHSDTICSHPLQEL
ncbi:hypothetical protein MHYP_G00006400 [Metynnis hypsauchen]